MQPPLIIDSRYVAQSEIKQGAFGIVYQGFDTITKQKIAIKLEKGHKSHNSSSLTTESRLLTRLKGIKGIPELIFFGKTGESRALILTFLGNDLQFYLQKQHFFSLKTIIKLSISLLNTLNEVHDKGIVHRDIKPDNILTSENKREEQIYLCDFGISKLYFDKGRHTDYKVGKPFIGTVRFASEAAHKGFEVSRKDDLESLFFVLVYLLKGKLPWQDLDRKLGSMRKDRIGSMKSIEKLLEIFYDLPEEMIIFLKYVKNLTFKETPNYSFLKELIVQMAQNKGINYVDSEWDWIKKPNKTVESINKVKEVTYYEKSNKKEKKNFDIVNPFKIKISNNNIEKLKTTEEDNKSVKVTTNLKKTSFNHIKCNTGSFKNLDKIDNINFLGVKHIKENNYSNNSINNNLEPEKNNSNTDNVYFNSKSWLSSNNDTKDSSIRIKNKDFSTLKFNVEEDKEENAFETELEEYINQESMQLKLSQIGKIELSNNKPIFNYTKFL